jgi:hypothetical protein
MNLEAGSQTIISMVNYTTHHHANISQPVPFGPARWLDSKCGTQALKEAWMPSPEDHVCAVACIGYGRTEMILWRYCMARKSAQGRNDERDRSFLSGAKGRICDLFSQS